MGAYREGLSSDGPAFEPPGGYMDRPTPQGPGLARDPRNTEITKNPKYHESKMGLVAIRGKADIALCNAYVCF
jgi:hypothetical protein